MTIHVIARSAQRDEAISTRNRMRPRHEIASLTLAMTSER
jgi:hypothetical protein